ncbi:sugar phosphate isomerase/epimerase [Halobacillus salinarum]|uniref:Sugar phosphate isomerase/epimerase n=1 Tax=Halobacillus salinarum TaxID=2932257 RepID=A0ABY4ELX2_9BACI|nr:sugar phosphate isomerase/epimerase family protein [Halobacillus salinarum]UOQ45444.1 sugar phosphate isomerase/epimerase [Halobacillus salinarum]
MKKGINAWCFPPELDAEGIFSLAEKLKYDGVELNLEDKAPGIFTMETSEEEILNVKSIADRHGMSIYSISTDLLWKYPLTANDEHTRLQGKAIVNTMLEFARLCGAQSVLVVPGLVTEDVSYAAAYERAVAAVREAAAKAEQLGIKIGVENVWNKFLYSPLEFRRFLEDVDSSHVGMYLDIGNVVRDGYPEHWIESLGDQLVQVHLKDFKEAVGDSAGFVPLLAGDVDWQKTAASLKKAGYRGYVAPEIPPHKHHYELLLKQTAEVVETFFGE